MALEIRRLSESDSRELTRLITDSYGDGTGMWFARMPSEEEAEAVVRAKLKMLAEGSIIDNVAVHNGRILGDCEIVIKRHMGILGILVDGAHRGTGVGRALLTSSLREALKSGIATVIAEVEEDNHYAVAFFTRNGFQLSGQGANTVERSGRSWRVVRLEFNLNISRG